MGQALKIYRCAEFGYESTTHGVQSGWRCRERKMWRLWRVRKKLLSRAMRRDGELIRKL